MTNSRVSDSTLALSTDDDRVIDGVGPADLNSPGSENQSAIAGHSSERVSPAPVAASSAVGGAATSSPLRSRTMSVLALSLGIASFFFAQSVVVPLAAVIFGVFGLRDEPTGRNFSIWGIVLACVATFGWVIFLAAGALLFLPLAVISSL